MAVVAQQQAAATGLAVYRGRPSLSSRNFICAKCQAPPKHFAYYAAEVARPERARVGAGVVSGPGVFDCGAGYLHGTAGCHGEQLEFIATFDQAWLAIDSGKPIVIFDQNEALPLAGSEEIDDKGRNRPLEY